MRARDHGFVVGQLPTGPANAITDVAGVRVGHANHVPDHTGVTAVWPHGGDPWHAPYFCATAALNGAGELTGTHDDRGMGLPGGAGLPDGHAVRRRRLRGRDARAHGARAAHRPRRRDHPRRRRVRPLVLVRRARRAPVPDEALVARALDTAAGGAVAEGQVGAGVGMETFGYAAGIGTSSRVVGEHTVGVLVLANYGLTGALRPLRPAGGPRARERDGLERRGLVHLPRGDRRAAAPAPAAATGAAAVPGAGAHRLLRLARLGRDRVRLDDREPLCRATSRTRCVALRMLRDDPSACSSRPAPRPPRRPCSTRSAPGASCAATTARRCRAFPRSASPWRDSRRAGHR